MSATRPIVFWVAMFAAVVAVVILLREVLLPFVAGMVLAYLLNPLAQRIERLGMNRLLATLAIIILVVVTIGTVLALVLPVIIDELSHFFERFPVYVRRIHELAANPSRPWLSKIVGEGLGEAERSIEGMTTLPSNWLELLPEFSVVGGTSPYVVAVRGRTGAAQSKRIGPPLTSTMSPMKRVIVSCANPPSLSLRPTRATRSITSQVTALAITTATRAVIGKFNRVWAAASVMTPVMVPGLAAKRIRGVKESLAFAAVLSDDRELP